MGVQSRTRRDRYCRERDFVPVERGAPLIVEHTPRRELWLTHPFLVLPPFDASFDGLDGASDGFLNEVRGEVGFVAEFVVECVSRGRVGRDTLSVGFVGSTELGGTVGAVKELPSGFVEVIASFIGNDEFDGCSTPDLHISDEGSTVNRDMGVSRLQSGGCVAPCRFPPRPTRSLRSLLEVGGSTSKFADGRPP